MFQAFAGCEALSGRIIIKANINGKLIDATHYDYDGCFGRVSLNENAILTLICSKNVFDLFYDDTRPNKIKAGVADYNAKIELRMI